MAASTLSHKDFCLEKYENSSVPFLINRKLLIHKQLEKSARAYCVYSDLHGSYEKYLHWLKTGMGYFRIIISEILGASYSKNIYEKYERLFLLANRARVNSVQRHVESEKKGEWEAHKFFNEAVPKKFIETISEIEKFGLSKRRIIEDILKILRLTVRGDEHRIMKAVPPMFLENILKLFFKEDRGSYNSLIDGIIGNEHIYNISVSVIIKLILLNCFEKHINLGDTFDRGDGSDKLIRFYRAYFGHPTNDSDLHYIWGNHDILWLGASIGNPVCAMTALRISMRYSNIDFLFRYGFNLDKLKNFAQKCYKEKPTGKYIKECNSDIWPEDLASKMAKVLLVLESKLTVLQLKESLKKNGDIDYRPYLEHYSALLQYMCTDMPEDSNAWKAYMAENPLYTDCFFPTIDSNNPEALTPEEKEVADDIVTQFCTLPKLHEDIRWMFQKGETYRVMDNTVYYHAALPATEEMTLAEVKGMKGKELLNYVQRDIKRIGETYIDKYPTTTREKMFFWFLWCGKKSPFFCKSKMATLERAIFDKKEAKSNPVTTHEEKKNSYYKHIHNDNFLNRILTEFHADKICMGHTPVPSVDRSILSQNLRAFIIDGGASSAYGDRGAILINTPDYTYVTFHPALEELQAAEREDRLPEMIIEPLEEKKNLKLGNMDKGYFLRRELNAIDELLETRLDKWTDKYFF